MKSKIFSIEKFFFLPKNNFLKGTLALMENTTTPAKIIPTYHQKYSSKINFLQQQAVSTFFPFKTAMTEGGP